MAICKNPPCDNKTVKNKNHCCVQCKADYRLILNREKAIAKHGEGWDTPKRCKSEGCAEVLSPRTGESPSNYIRREFHSSSCNMSTVDRRIDTAIKSLKSRFKQGGDTNKALATRLALLSAQGKPLLKAFPSRAGHAARSVHPNR